MNFGGTEIGNTPLEKARFIVVPIPYDLTASYQAGARSGPVAIMNASEYIEFYDEELDCEPCHAGIHTTLPVEAEVGGPAIMVEKIRRKILEYVSENTIPVVLGGDHSVTIGVVQAMIKKYPALSVLHLDAHADMRDSYQGSPYSHACVSRRVTEMCPMEHVGIRSMSMEEAEYIKKNNIRLFTPDSIKKYENWPKKVCKNLSKDVYVSIDLDVFDPSVIPATGTPEPGGLLWKDIMLLLKEVASNFHVRGFDVVELSPIPGMVASDFTTAKLIYKFMGYIGLNKTRRWGNG